MKKCLAFALILTLLFSLCACSGAGKSTEAEVPAASEAPAAAAAQEAPAAPEASAAVEAPSAPAAAAMAPAAAPAQPVSDSPNGLIGQQIQLIAACFNTFRQSDDESTWYYAVTDLDHNGRLELLATTKSGSGAAKLKAWEVSPNGANLILSSMQTIPAPFDVDEEDLRVDFFILNMRSDSLDTYFDSQTGLFYYIVVDAVESNHFNIPAAGSADPVFVDGNGSAVMTGVQAVSMSNGSVDPGFVLGSSISYSVDGSEPRVICSNAKGDEISQEEFLNLASSTFTDCTHFNTAFDWFTADEATLLERFVESYATFDGVRDPDRPEAGIALMAAQNYGGVYIVKNPTDEKHNAGETAEFIANANAYDKVTWTFVAPDGKTYNEQEFVKLCGGGSVEGTGTGDLKIRNVNSVMNGWSVFATFDYMGASARSSTAYLYVWGATGPQPMDEFYEAKPYLAGGLWTCPMCGVQAYGSQCGACGFNPVAYYAVYTSADPGSYGWYYGVNGQTPVSSLTPTQVAGNFVWSCPNCGESNQDVVYCFNCGYRYGDPVGLSPNSIAANTAREAAQGAVLRTCQYCGNIFNADYDVCPYCYRAPNDGSEYDRIQWQTMQEYYQGATLRTCQYCGNLFNDNYDVCPYCGSAPNDGTYYGGYYDSSSYPVTSSGVDYHPDGGFVGYTKGGNPIFARHNADGSEYNTILCPRCGYEHSMAVNCPNCGAGYT